ncbi:MAG: DEAD/DEAH box helicase [Desulfovibrio sp.]|nr:DEAD/DEAH box helicase [Desulfovibrio sp.]
MTEAEEPKKLGETFAGCEIQEPSDPLPPATLESLPESLQAACEAAGWNSLTPVQALAIPYLLAGRDIMVQSRTGSGKTGCYLLPMIAKLDPAKAHAQALVLVPTRELALQVDREAATLFAQSGIKSCAVYGGTGYREQLKALADGCQLVIGTPGRVLDHLLRRSLNLGKLRELVFDEADRMLSIGFYPDMVEIASHIPKQRQTALFSATYPPHVLKLAAEFMTSPEMLSLSRKEVHVPDVEHLFCEVKPMDRDRALVRLIETENPSSAIIFCNTKADVHYLAGVLKGFGYRADELSADLPQKKREAVLARIRDGSTQYLVATDVAARGIDIPDLSHVFLYSPPEDKESYIHRAGRTGRAGAAGTVISLVDIMQKMDLERIARNYKINLREIKVPTDEEVSEVVCNRLNTVLESRLRSLTGLERMRVNRYLPLAREMAAAEAGDDEEALAIMAMLLDDYHRQMRNERRYPGQSLVRRKPASQKSRGRRRPAQKRNQN